MKQIKENINGVEYTLQKPGIEEVISIRSQILNGGALSQLKAYELYLENVVIKPKKKIEDFEGDLQSLDALMIKCESFLYGGK